MNDQEEARVLAMLAAADAGEATISGDDRSWHEVYAGNVEFNIEHGDDEWTVVVFNDCDDWDYIDHITTPEGRTFEYPFEPGGPPMTDKVADWIPSHPWRWGIGS